MPSFDIVSKLDLHEVRNAVDQANREIGNRFDFKGTDSRVEMVAEDRLMLHAPNKFQIGQVLDVLRDRLARREVDLKALDAGQTETNLNAARQPVTLKQGIDTDLARRLVKDIKASKLKVQAQIQGDSVRVSGKKRDDLQNVMALLRQGEHPLPLQFENFRD